MDASGQPVPGPGLPAPAPRRKRIGRRVLISGGALLGLLLIVGACGGGDQPDVTAGSAAAPQPVAAPETPTPSPTPSPVVPVDTEGDGVSDDVDDYPGDPSRHSTSDRDGDGTANGADVAPDDPAIASWPTAAVTRVVDGDTIDVAGLGRIRLIGIDTPEQGECGYQNATDLMEYLVAGKTVTLIPGARDDRDRYDRLLRYVEVDGGKDAGREMIGSGWAIARYDSRDGYGTHPREADYIALDAQVPDNTCPAPAPAPAPAPPSSSSGTSGSSGSSGAGYDGYTGCRAYGGGYAPNAIDEKGRPYTKINCTTKTPIG